MNARTSRLRLGLVGPMPPPSGGMANQTRQLAALLRAEGMDVSIARTNEPLRPAWLAKLRGVRGLIHQIPYRRSVWQLAKGADVLHVMANSGWSWHLLAAPAIRSGATCRVPVVVNYRGGLAREFLARSSGSVLRTLRKADVLVVPSRFLQEVFGVYGIEARVIPNVVDVDIFRPASGHAPGASGMHVVITRNLEALYGIDTALRAVALLRPKLPHIRLSVAGSGPERVALEGLAASLGIADIVRFTGRLEVAEIASLYRTADVALNPSRADNTPNSLLEAAACGIPLISTNVGGVPYLVEHGRTAWLVPADSPEAMAEGLMRVLTDDGLRSALRTNASALAQSCSWPVVRHKWLELYAELAARRAGRMLTAHAGS